ncbi:ATPase [Advenella faeciporci]|uniref:histidine kinase n=2 Tax=Advenella faeciporci TaxID=797535 RepID=A0A918JF11_9BURK|nr:ATPase [Advenella faeciporci]
MPHKKNLSFWSSLRFRLLAGTLAWVLLTIIVAGWGLDSLFKQHMMQQVRAELTLHFNQLLSFVAVDANGKVSVPHALSDARFDQPLSGLYWQIDQLDEQGQAETTGLLRSRSLWDNVLPTAGIGNTSAALQEFIITDADGSVLNAVGRIIQPEEESSLPLRLVVAINHDIVALPAERFRNMLILALTVLAVGLMVAVTTQVILGLRPFGRLRKSLADVHEGKTLHIEGDFPAELEPLVNDFNQVLDVNAKVIERARTQAGNLAHAVKTPLAILSNAAAKEQSSFSALVKEQVAMAQRQVNYHLARARAAAAMQASSSRTPVKKSLEALIRVMQRLYAERNLDISLHLQEDNCTFRGEEQDFQEMLGNLLDNACKWASHAVSITVVSTQNEIVITVDDDGEGLPETQQDLIFQRGIRVDEKKPGTGLGLDIVRDLTDLYQGTVMTATSSLGGLRVVLRLPAAN